MPLSDLAKGGWHPKGKDGGKESWRGDFKGINQIAGKLGMPTHQSADPRKDHVSTPLSSLKDPSLFGPPPKNVSYHGGAALPNQITPDKKGWGSSQTSLSSQLQAQPQALVRTTPQPPVQARPTLQPPVQSRAIPQPPARPQIQARQQVEQEEEQQYEEEELSEPVPYTPNTSGLSTQGFVKPPMRHTELAQEEPQKLPGYVRPTPKPSPGTKPAPAPKSFPAPISRQAVTSSPGAKPQPPPRLPPRQNSNITEFTPDPPPAYSHEPTATQQSGYINQGAANSLAKAGVSVSGFNIGSAFSGTPAASTTTTQPAGQMNELQSRFARFNTSSSNSTPSPTATTTSSATGGGTTWAQKQQALQTASSFQKDPSSVSFKDMRQAASTANNFNQRHGAQVAAGFGAAQKFGASASGAFARSGFGSPASNSNVQVQPVEEPVAATAVLAKKKPPPPPKKKEFLMDGAGGDDAPPVPLASKPR